MEVRYSRGGLLGWILNIGSQDRVNVYAYVYVCEKCGIIVIDTKSKIK